MPTCKMLCLLNHIIHFKKRLYIRVSTSDIQQLLSTFLDGSRPSGKLNSVIFFNFLQGEHFQLFVLGHDFFSGVQNTNGIRTSIVEYAIMRNEWLGWLVVLIMNRWVVDIIFNVDSTTCEPSNLHCALSERHHFCNPEWFFDSVVTLDNNPVIESHNHWRGDPRLTTELGTSRNDWIVAHVIFNFCDDVTHLFTINHNVIYNTFIYQELLEYLSITTSFRDSCFRGFSILHLLCITKSFIISCCTIQSCMIYITTCTIAESAGLKGFKLSKIQVPASISRRSLHLPLSQCSSNCLIAPV